VAAASPVLRGSFLVLLLLLSAELLHRQAYNKPRAGVKELHGFFKVAHHSHDFHDHDTAKPGARIAAILLQRQQTLVVTEWLWTRWWTLDTPL